MHKRLSRCSLTWGLALLALSATSAAMAQSWPQKPIKVIAPYPIPEPVAQRITHAISEHRAGGCGNPDRGEIKNAQADQGADTEQNEHARQQNSDQDQ